MPDFHLDVFKLVSSLEKNQYTDRDFARLIPNCDILTRQELQKIQVNKNLPYVSTSGSTGEPVFVQKYDIQRLWYAVTSMRELLWLKWNPSNKIAIIKAGIKEYEVEWHSNKYLFGDKIGKCHMHPTSGDLQSWLDKIQPDYLHSYPSIISTLDTSKLKGVKSTGERGGTCYSSEELGTIGLQCPDNPDVYHIMENIVIEINDDNDIIATDLTHPYIKRYKIGDKGEFATCSCGRKLQTINKNVVGRVRNMVKYPDGTKAWPMFGTIRIRNISQYVKRVQCIQTSLNDVTLKVQGTISLEDIPKVKQLVSESLNHPFNVNIEFVESFNEGKFEEFVCKI